MKRTLLAFFLSVSAFAVYGQSITARLAAAYSRFENDPQLQNGSASLFVMDAATGAPVFQKNARVGLMPASTQKIITAATAYALLGKDYRYETSFGISGPVVNGELEGSVIIRGSGDPTLGSWRWVSTSTDSVMKRVVAGLRSAGFSGYSSMRSDEKGWMGESIPDGWIWQDIGNYYGAGTASLNWHENQFDLLLSSGAAVGSKVSVRRTEPSMYNYAIRSLATAGPAGSGDNAYVYLPSTGNIAVVRGTIPLNETAFRISAAMPSGRDQFLATLSDSLARYDIRPKLSPVVTDADSMLAFTILHREYSPALDSIVFWFLRKSINLYGEALVRTVASLSGPASSKQGLTVLRQFWARQGIPPGELGMVDGSGLSPVNRVTTHAQATVLRFAKTQQWFEGFYQALPTYNGMKMKSGTIGGAKAFCGYHRSAAGKEYIFSFIVNNFSGSAAGIVQKMYTVLDQLK